MWRASLPSVEDARPLGLALATPIPARAYSQLAGLSQPAMGCHPESLSAIVAPTPVRCAQSPSHRRSDRHRSFALADSRGPSRSRNDTGGHAVELVRDREAPALLVVYEDLALPRLSDSQHRAPRRSSAHVSRLVRPQFHLERSVADVGGRRNRGLQNRGECEGLARVFYMHGRWYWSRDRRSAKGSRRFASSGV